LPPSLALSRSTIEQSDTFAVTLADVPLGIAPKVTWHDRTYDLLRAGERWLGFFGADAKQAPGYYALEVALGTTTLSRRVAVAKRDFPVTVLAVTPELEAQGYTPPAIQTNVASENARLNAVLIYTPEARFSRTFLNPLDNITVVGAYGNVRKSGSVELQHLGADLDAAEGTPVYAVNDGAVNLAEEFTNYGRTLVVDHGVGIFSFYLHLSELKVKVGDRVTRGDIIARSGNTGYSIAPHLHFSVRIRNASVDPLRFIETANAALVDSTLGGE
jgi:murein DD-endopeptidase MepM/ murein hydrolase activator NlpD